MADTKVSELTSATSVGGSDSLYLIQSGTSKKVTAATLFANAANVTLKGNVNIDPSVQTLTSPGTIDLTKPVTHLSITSESNGGELLLPIGTPGQVKIIVLTSTDGSYWTIDSNITAHGNTNHVVRFSANGDTITALCTNNKWYMIGGTASVNT